MSFQCGCLRFLVTGILLLPITGCEKSAAEKVAERQLQDIKKNDEEFARKKAALDAINKTIQSDPKLKEVYDRVNR